VLRALLTKHGVALKKGYGQNFLVDGHALQEIVQAVALDRQTGVLEIGPGAGVLTAELAKRAGRVVAVEKDVSLRPLLEESLAPWDNIRLCFADILDKPMEALIHDELCGFERVVLVANLPYYVTTPILFHVLEAKTDISDIVVLVQKEVATRMVARPGGKDYGVLSVTVQYHADVRLVADIAPACFMPPPSVHSTVVHLNCQKMTPVRADSEISFVKVVRSAFGTRRKTLENALAAGLGWSKEHVREMLEEAHISPQRRGETLSLEEFIHLSNIFATWKS